MRRLAFLLLLLALTGARAETFYVPNTGENTISQYDDNGNATSFTSAFVSGPIGVALDRQGNLFVSTNGNTIEKFSPSGADLGTFASVGVNFPMGLAFDRAGNLYVANFSGNTVQQFTPAGVGSVFASIIHPTGLAFDAAGNLYVADFANTIEQFSPAGVYLGTFATGRLNNPEGLAFDSFGNLYAANNGSDTVEVFSPRGDDLGFAALNVGGPVGLAFDRAQSLYVVAARESAIVKITTAKSSLFAPTGFAPGFIAVQKPPILVNISTRLNVGIGENVLDSGFIVRGTGTKTLLIRGLGPSLGNAGLANPLADPVLELHDRTGAILQTNDSWKATQESAIAATGIPPANDAEAAMIVTLNAGSYTVVESGKNSTTGAGLMEIYDLTNGFGPDLANLSTRGFVGTAGNVMIAGFILGAPTGGNGSVLVRALGPSLGALGVAGPLADPVLELYNADGTLIAANDNWQSTQQAAIEATGAPPSNTAEAAIVATLAPGNYTAVESGKNGGTGVGLIEVYNLN
ncbi:MAG: NHL repeat-containing protein [Chthoniobacterales bacterium]